MPSNFRTLILCLTTVALIATAGCGGRSRSKELLGSADKLYDAAKRAMDASNFGDATR